MDMLKDARAGLQRHLWWCVTMKRVQRVAIKVGWIERDETADGIVAAAPNQ